MKNVYLYAYFYEVKALSILKQSGISSVYHKYQIETNLVHRFKLEYVAGTCGSVMDPEAALISSLKQGVRLPIKPIGS
jgi:hypothetical protein